MNIRQATKKDVSRIAEMMVVNYRVNFFDIFKNEDFYFDELNVLDTAQEYFDNPKLLENTYVYEDVAVKGFVRINGDEIEKLFVEPQFQGQRIGEKLLRFALDEKQATWLWVLKYNERGIKFYERNGMYLNGETMLEEGWIPLIKMKKKEI